MSRFLAVAGVWLILSLCGCQPGGDLPADQTLAKQEAKAAIQSWIKLLNEGKGDEFLRAALPAALLSDKDVVTESGAFRPEFMRKFYQVLPNLHYALQEALTVEPAVRGGNVIFEFPAEMASDQLFQDRKMYLGKTGDQWHFNGPALQK